MHDQLAHVVERQLRGAFDEQSLGVDDPLQTDLQSSTIEQGHDRRRCCGAQRARADRLLHRGITRRQRFAEEVRPGSRGLPHLHQAHRISLRSAGRRRDHGRRAAEPLLLRQARRSQLGARLPRDARRDLGVDAVESTLHQPHRAMRLEQLCSGQLGRVRRIRPHVFEALHGLEEGAQMRVRHAPSLEHIFDILEGCG